MKKMETTLCLLRRNEEILLAMKKRGFGEGKYNGVGGKIEGTETPEAAMLRETKEEIGVTPIQYDKVGVVSFDEFYKDEKVHLIFHLYMVTEWEEMQPKWFSIDSIPYNQMLPDDKYWLPLILEGKKIDAYFDFDEEWNLLSKDIKELSD